MDKFTLSIELGNDAMQSPADVGRALDKLSETFVTITWAGMDGGRIADENGNTVGSWEHEAGPTLGDREATTWDDVDGSECQHCGGAIPADREHCPDCGARSEMLNDISPAQ